MFSKTSTDLLVQFIRRPRAVEQDDAIRVPPRDYAVSVGYALTELGSLSLDSVRALSDTSRGRLGIDLEDERDVREEATGRDPVQLVDLFDAEIAREALVGKRRIEVAVGDDVVPRIKGRPDHAVDELGPRCGED